MWLNTIPPTSFIRNLSLVCVLLVGIMWSKAAQANTSVAPRNKVIVIPFETTPPPHVHILIKLSVNKCPCNFELDTGTNTSLVIDAHAVKELHLPVRRLHTGREEDYSGETLISRLDLPFASEVVHNIRAGVADIPLARTYKKCAGVLGISLLTGETAQLDFVTRRLTLTNDTAPLHPQSSGIVVPLHNKEGLYYMPLSAGRQKFRDVLIDTGSEETSLPLAHITSQDIQGIRRSTNLNVNSRAEFTWDVLVSELQIGDLHEPNVEVGIAADNDDAVLGMNVLSRFCITFNLARKQMLLEWADDYPQRATILRPERYEPLSRWTKNPLVGLILEKTPGKSLSVKHIIGDSPAAKYGMRKSMPVSSLILTLNGKSTKTMTTDQLNDCLSQRHLNIGIQPARSGKHTGRF